MLISERPDRIRIDFDYASEVVDDDDVATLAWGVCEQPWQAGDLLMLRMASGIPDDGVQATSDQECLTAASGQASTPTAEPELTVTATPVPTLTPTPTATPTP